MDFFQILALIVPAAIVSAAPLILTALGGVLSERSGVVNIGLEGLMMFGAFIGAIFTHYGEQWGLGGGSPWMSFVVAIVAGALFAVPHAVASISLKADQVVSGVALNFLAAGLSIFLTKKLFGAGQTPDIQERIGKGDVPVLSKIPVIGDLLFSNAYSTSFVAVFLAFVVWYIIYKTPFGLRLRSVGEHPMAADTMGINVIKTRYISVIMGGAFAGLGGAIYVASIAGNFTGSTISGQGFMALAAMIFGKWHPLGAMGAALFFGLAQSLSITGEQIPLLKDIPDVYLLILPYVLTILALAGFVGRADAPKASGQPYEKGKR
ncbi:simple sugar transport system permease protein [Fictibacillus solisalsi]|uniref:Simple sugar transport system permease protein n=1 Tax=Fictibacillus solisalsi TaxID=459525 RepID=A0A1G9V076_9BACL|nr:ABC transporter permease [Fictibacillus solisalsi]SDM65651.1 simple sugar transport system permease protein [Fictibacillus solisalsi]